MVIIRLMIIVVVDFEDVVVTDTASVTVVCYCYRCFGGAGGAGGAVGGNPGGEGAVGGAGRGARASWWREAPVHL